MSSSSPVPRIQNKYRWLVENAAARHGIDPLLVEAVILTESSGLFHAYRFEPGFWDRYLAKNPRYKDMNPREASASYGLMQIMYSTAVEEGFTGMPWELFAPAFSIEFGCKHLAKHMAWADRFEDAPLTPRELASALAAYNGGRRGNEPDEFEDRNAAYAKKVLHLYGRLLELPA